MRVKSKNCYRIHRPCEAAMFFLPFFLFCSKCSKHFGIVCLEVKMYFFFHSFIHSLFGKAG